MNKEIILNFIKTTRYLLINLAENNHQALIIGCTMSLIVSVFEKDTKRISTDLDVLNTVISEHLHKV